MAELADTGYTTLAYADAPAEIQRVARLVLDQRRRWLAWVRSWPPEAERSPYWGAIDWDAQLADLEGKIARGEDFTIEYMAPGGREVGPGVIMVLGEQSEEVMTIVPARYASPASPLPGDYYHFLLTQTGDSNEAAVATIERLSKEWLDLRDRRQWDESDWVEPADPRLQQVVPIPFTSTEHADYAVLVDLQQVIAKRTGLSIISDFFTGAWVRTYPHQRALAGPLWRDLYVLGQAGEFDQAGQFEWKLVGDCLVFHRKHWYVLAQRELPESFIERWRAKLEDQERFTLDDIVQLAVELEGRPTPALRYGLTIPDDLLEAGADAASGPYRGMLLLYHALTPEERAAARTPEGLPLSQLPSRKQREITDYVLPPGVPRATLQTPFAEFVAGTVFFLNAGSREEAGAPPTQYEFRLTYPSEPMLSMGDWTFGVRVAPDLSARSRE